MIKKLLAALLATALIALNIPFGAIIAAADDNLLVNWNFSAENTSSSDRDGAITGWTHEEGTTSRSAYTEARNQGSTGGYILSFWRGSQFEAGVYQTVTGLSDGIYTFSAEIANRSTTETTMYVKVGEDATELEIPTTSDSSVVYENFTIEEIVVTGGTAIVGFHSSGPGGSNTSDAHVDNASFVYVRGIDDPIQLDTEELEQAIEEAQAKLDAAQGNIGTEVGQYRAEDLVALEAAIEEAKNILENATLQSQIDGALTSLKEISGNFKAISDSVIEEPEFSGKEWYNEAEVVEINREYPRTTFVPFDDQESARQNSTYSTMSNSNNFLNLNGEWDFRLDMYTDIAEAENFYEEDYDYDLNEDFTLGDDEYVNGDWIKMEVPFAWQVAGEYAGVLGDNPVYYNQNYPWMVYGHDRGYTSGSATAYAPLGTSASGKINPVGSYIKTIEIPENWDGKQVFINFTGVSQGMYVWVNGHSVGYGEDSFTSSEFDITPYINPGETNTISVRVYRWTTGGFLESQDMIDTSGIIRDVYLTASPETNIKDFTVVTDLVDNNVNSDSYLNVEFELTNRHGLAVEDYTVSMSLYKENGEAVFENQISENFSMMSNQESATVELSYLVENPDKWSAESPTQYDAVFTLYDTDGNIVETIGQKVGFREISMEGSGTADDPMLVNINGEPIYFKGVNRNEISVYNGKALTREEMEAEVQLMLENNINSVRTSHYPQNPYMYELYNKYGIYVLDELNIETHNGRSYGIPTDEIWANSMLSRSQNAVERDKNYSCVVMWSLGNEAGSGTNHTNNATWIRENDPTRLIHYQGDNTIADVYSTMYPTASSVKSYNTNTKPYVLCEYQHSLGNSGGGFTAYIDAFESNLRNQGGWIWEWKDHSIYTLSDDGSYGFWGYGGDWDETFSITSLSTTSNFCADGIILADGTASPALTEVKAGYQDIKMTVEDDASLMAGNISFRNNALFTNADIYDLTWELYEDDVCIASGIMTCDIDPQTTDQVINVPYSEYLPDDPKANTSYYLNLSFTYKDEERPEWAEEDLVVAAEQFELPVDSPYWGIGVSSIDGFGNVTETDSEVTVTGATDQDQDFNVTISKESGMMTEYIVDEEVLIEKGPTPNFYRAVVDNDNGTSVTSSNGYLYERAWRDVWANKEDMNVSVDTSHDKKIIISVDAVLPTKNASNVSAKSDFSIEYTVYGNGDVMVDQKLSPNSNATNIPVVGSYLQLPLEYSNVEYYGSGPDENYIDRYSGTSIGVYQTTTEEMFIHRSRPQETGNRTNTKWVAVTNDDGYGLLAISHDRMEFSALNYSADEITTYNYGVRNGPLHPEDMDDPTTVTLSLNHIQMGVGGETWSTGPYDESLVKPNKDYSYTYTLRPITPNTDNMESSKSLLTGQPVISNIYANGEPLDGFDERIKEYTVSIEGWEDYPEITVDSYEGVSVNISEATSDDPRVVITCTLGEDIITYVVNIERNMNFVTAIYLDGELLNSFSESIREYTVSWKSNAAIPTITADAIDNVSLDITQFDEDTLTASISAESAWGDVVTYTITLKLSYSEDYQRPEAWGEVDIQTLPTGDVKYISVDSRNNYYYINNQPVSASERGDLPFVGLYPNRRIADGTGGTADKIKIDETTGNKIYYHQNSATSGYVHGDTLVGLEAQNLADLENQTIVMYAKVRADEGPFELAFRDGNAECRSATDVFRVAFTDAGILYSGAGVTSTGTNNAVSHANMTTLVDELNRDKYYEVWMLDTVNSTSMGHSCSVYIRYTDDNGEVVTAKAENMLKDYYTNTMQYAAFELSSGNLSDAVSLEEFQVYTMNTDSSFITYDVQGKTSTDLPTGDEATTLQYNATAIHNENDGIPVPNIEDQQTYWEIVGSPSGVSIDQNGLVTLTKDFAGKYFDISVSNPDKNWTAATYRVYVGEQTGEADKQELSEQITIAQALDSEGYTTESWALLQTALTTAISVNEDESANQDAVDAAANSLKNAIAALVEKTSVDKTALQALIDECLALNEEDYTESSWAAFSTTLEEAKELLANADATQTQIDGMYNVLTLAKNYVLKPVSTTVNKSRLETAIAKAQEAINSGEVDNAIKSVQDAFYEAFKVAKNVFANDNATQAEVDAAHDTLSEMIYRLGFIKGDKNALQYLYNLLSQLDMKDYEAGDDKEAFKTALANAADVLADEDALADDVNDAYAALEEAFLALIELDRSELEKEIATSEAINEKLDSFVEAGKSEFTTALENAKTVFAKEEVSQAEIDAALTALQTARLNLRYKANKDLLSSIVAKAMSFDLSLYTDESAAALNEAVAAAQLLLDDDTLSQDDQGTIIAAAVAVSDAINGLVLKTDDGSSLDDGSSSDDGSSTGSSSTESSSSGSGSTGTSDSGKTSSSKTTTASSVAKTGDPMVISSVIILLIAFAAVTIAKRRRRD